MHRRARARQRAEISCVGRLRAVWCLNTTANQVGLVTTMR
jgi:hypothetical protein